MNINSWLQETLEKLVVSRPIFTLQSINTVLIFLFIWFWKKRNQLTTLISDQSGIRAPVDQVEKMGSQESPRARGAKFGSSYGHHRVEKDVINIWKGEEEHMLFMEASAWWSKGENMNDKFKEVINISSTIPSIYVHNTYFSMFDQHTKGLGMNFLSMMDYEGGCLDINGQDISNPFMAQGRPKYQGLGYGWREFGEFPKRLEEHQPFEDEMSPPYENVNSSPKWDEYLKGPCMASSTPLCRGCNPRHMYNS